MFIEGTKSIDIIIQLFIKWKLLESLAIRAKSVLVKLPMISSKLLKKSLMICLENAISVGLMHISHLLTLLISWRSFTTTNGFKCLAVGLFMISFWKKVGDNTKEGGLLDLGLRDSL